MHMRSWWKRWLAAALVWAGCLCPLAASGAEAIPVTDARGRTVMVPARINRVVTVSDGLVEGVMTRLRVADRIVALGSACVPKTWSYEIPGSKGERFTYTQGMNTVFHLNPGFRDLPLVARSGTGINFEAVAALNPDLIIVRTGSCSLTQSRDILDKTLGLLEALEIPLVVLKGPNTLPNPGISSISREIRILGEVFQKTGEAEALAAYLESCVALVRERTRDIRPEARKKLLLLGLSPKARSRGGAGHVKGEDTLQSYFIREVVRAENAYTGPGAWNILNTEQLLALDPDLIVLVTAWGYHPPEELYEAHYYQGLQEMRAVKDRAVTVLPWTPCNCEKRLEYPIDIMVMAKAAYPERFRDIRLDEWLLGFYQNIYRVDPETAGQLLSRQWMDWTREK